MPTSDLEPPSPVSESPWFWVMLFSLAGLAAVFTIGPKFERREQGIETKFHARERGLGRETIDQPGDEAPQQPHWEPIFTLGPIAAILAAIAAVSMFNVTRLHRQQLAKRRAENSAKNQTNAAR